MPLHNYASQISMTCRPLFLRKLARGLNDAEVSLQPCSIRTGMSLMMYTSIDVVLLLIHYICHREEQRDVAISSVTLKSTRINIDVGILNDNFGSVMMFRNEHINYSGCIKQYLSPFLTPLRVCRADPHALQGFPVRRRYLFHRCI